MPPVSPAVPDPRASKARTHLISGFTGGLTSAIVLQPFDLLKTRVQQSTHSTVTSSIKDLTKFSELWRGTLPSALRTSIGSALYLTFLNSTRVFLSKFHEQSMVSSSSKLVRLSPQENLVTGMFSRAVIGWVTMPFTIIKVRYESNLYNYRSLNEAVRSIYHKESYRGFFNGYFATAARDAPYAGLYVLFYEQLKTILPSFYKIDNQNQALFNTSKSAIINTTSAIFSASLATIITAPFDTIKTNMQLNPQYNFRRTCSVLYKKGGPKRFFDGLSLRLIRKGCSAGIAWCLYEELIKYFG